MLAQMSEELAGKSGIVTGAARGIGEEIATAFTAAGARVAAFDHKVVTAYRWPVDEFSERLARAGFREVDRLQRPGDGARPHAALAAVATDG